MYKFIKLKESFSKEEEKAIRFWKEGLDGWGYNLFKYAAINDIERAPFFIDLKNRDDPRYEEKLLYYTELFYTFEKAIEKCPTVDKNIIATRFINDYSDIGSAVKLFKYDSFTLFQEGDLGFSTVLHNFAQNEGRMYQLQGSSLLKDITKVGETFTEEKEALLSENHNFKIIDVQKVKIEGIKLNKIILA
jgi:hypothetical protein